MRIGLYSRIICAIVILSGVLVMDITAGAQTATQMTALEKKLYEAAKKEGVIEFWDSLSLKEVMQLWKGFESKYPGIKLNYFESTTDVREEKYYTEYSAGRYKTDIMPVSLLYPLFNEKKLLADLSDIINDTGYPKKFCSKDMDVVGVEYSLYGVAYNTKLVSPKDAPRSWEDLLNPKWNGKINVEDRLKYFVLVNDYWGEAKIVDYLRKLSKQNLSWAKGVTQIMTLLAAGEFPISIGMLFHRVLIMQANGSPVEWAQISPIAGQVTSQAVLRHAPHPNAAKLFLRWWMSPEGAAYVDAKRHKGNPAPGAGTQTSKILEKRGNPELYIVPSWTKVDEDALTEKYQKAIGFLK